MKTENYNTVIATAKNANVVYNAINNVHQWWTENFEGSSKKIGDEFVVTFGDTFIKLRVAELLTNYKVVWEVIGGHKHFLKNPKEWLGTKISFDIANENNEKTKLIFNHFGLVSSLECHSICTDAWNGYLHGSLKRLIETGKGTPDQKDEKNSEALVAS
jgi:hypothetical protein